MKVSLSKIRIDGGTQNRVHLNEEAVSEYADALTEGAQFPPVTVFFDGSDYWLADGFHRYHAHKNIGALDIEADVRNGTVQDAQLFSFGVNAQHGLRRTNADKRQAVERALNHPVSRSWSDNQIAKHCGVSVPFVGSVRRPEVAAKQSENRKSSAKNNNHTDNKAVIGLQNESNFVVGLQNQANVIPLKPKSNDSEIEEEIMKDFDPLKELEEAQKEIERLQAQIKAMCRDDLPKQIQKEIQARQGIEARLAQEMDRSNRFDTELRKYGRFAAELRKMLRVETNAQVIARIKSIMEAA